MSISVDPTSSAGTDPGSAVLKELCDHLSRSEQGDPALVCDFARAFFVKVPRQLVAERSIEDLAALTRGAFEFLRKGHDEGIHVEVVEPSEEGWDAPVTVIRGELADRPFIVDTIREYLSAENLPIQHYVYPVIGVERDAEGGIARITEPTEGNARALVHCEIPPIRRPERRQEIGAEIARRIRDVVAATDDFQPMLDALDRARSVVSNYATTLPERAEEVDEIEEFLRWLSLGNFVFLGYREYEIVEEEGLSVLRVSPASGLGILSDEENSAWADGVRLSDLTDELRRRVLDGPLLITSKTNAEATVHRRARMDYIGIKKLSEDGAVLGEHRFLGLFTSKAYAEHAEAIPILRRKLQEILQRSGAAPGSHDYKEIITIFNSMPKEELFQATRSELEREVQTVLSVLFSDEVQVSLRPDPLGRGVSVMVILPRGKFSGEVRHRIQDALRRRFDGTVLNYHLAMSAGDQARLHFYLSAPAEVVEQVAATDLVLEIRQIIRSWDDRLLEELARAYPAPEARRLASTFGSAFQEEYRIATLPEVAVQDLEELELLRGSGRQVSISLREPRGRGRAEAFRGVTILKLYLVGERLILSEFMPILENAGLRVIEVAPFAVSGSGLPEMMIYSFAVQDPEDLPIPVERARLLGESLLAVRSGDTPNDLYNALVLRAGLNWREVDVIRAYGNYAFQAGLVPTRFAAARALARYPELARLTAGLFLARFDPVAAQRAGLDTASRPDIADLRTQIGHALDAVATLTDDRAIRRVVNLIEATVRTSFFRHGGFEPTVRSGGVPYLSIKIAPGEMEELRRSRLLYEIFVYSSRMEGIHLRGAPVSRGGIRWSERPDDFRTEVLGLVQTQIVKNAVIVPGGSKGGFITKRLFSEREETMKEVEEQYRTLIRGMLDITDNLVDGEVVPPRDVVRYDGDDPYLVVAADKGTAHLSDVANGVAAEYGYWLDDAFASGGSNGYDHKKEGITARGGWECVRRHFREMGKDIQEEPFTVAGVGDMSGDVFGNGMLLSRQIRLIAAFDHRHVFIDPTPDPEGSYRERERLFRMGRSSWEDYDRSVRSPGAMVVPRASKEVNLTPEAREALQIDPLVHAMDGEALVRAVLRAPVELFWNGGIGTYVKDEEETNAEVGDPSNDPVRIDAHELRCRVVGEGGNLGLTQRARISYSLRGGRINTDALDNSAGVDMSDHEVNLKILLTPLTRGGQMSADERNHLLEEMTDEVGTLVLRNNIHQSLAVSLDEARSREALGDFTALISSFERERLLERGAEGIPGIDELEARAREGIGLTRPTLCVLLAYAKLQAKSHLLASGVPDAPATERYLIDYFPRRAIEAAGVDGLRHHRLRREIIATQMVSDLVDLMGASFLHRVSRDTGQPIESVIAAWYVASRIAGAAEIRMEVERLEGVHPSQTIYRWLFGLARVLERTTGWVLQNVQQDAPIEVVIRDILEGVGRLRPAFRRVVSGEDRALFEERMTELMDLGLSEQLAERLITLRFLPELLDILRIAQAGGTDPIETAEAYYTVADHFGVGWLQQYLRGADLLGSWDKRLAQALQSDLHRSHRTITRKILQRGEADADTSANVAAFEQAHLRELEQYRELFAELRGTEHPTLSGCAVAIRSLIELSGH